jgi:hypothetical protein
VLPPFPPPPPPPFPPPPPPFATLSTRGASWVEGRAGGSAFCRSTSDCGTERFDRTNVERQSSIARVGLIVLTDGVDSVERRVKYEKTMIPKSYCPSYKLPNNELDMNKEAPTFFGGEQSWKKGSWAMLHCTAQVCSCSKFLMN